MAKKISRRKFLKDAVIGGVGLGTGLGSYRITYGQAKKPAGPIKIGGQGAVSELAAFLLLAAIGYIVDSFGKMLSPAYNLSISQFTFVGEVLLIFWLFWKGVKGFDQASGLITKR